jgi:hypothetical protein
MKELFISIQAVKHIIDKYKLKPVNGDYKFKGWMLKEMKAFDRDNDVPPLSPEQLEDLHAMDQGQPSRLGIVKITDDTRH